MQVFSKDGQAPKSISELDKNLSDGRILNEWEAEQQGAFTKSIREQLGLPTEDKSPGERLFPGGPKRFRREPDPNYQPVELGTYDADGNFVRNKKQPYPRVGRDTFDTKGGGDNFPLYNFGSPQPMDFPGYMKELRQTLPDQIPLPRPRPPEAGPRADAGDTAEVLRQFASVLSDALRNKATLAAGGYIRGAGTTTSDSIPALLSDKEYVVNAQGVSKAGLAHLDWLNAGMPGYADGGAVIPGIGGILPAGSYDITPTDDGGAIINGVMYPPGSPILNDPNVKQALARARASKAQDEGKRHKSDFTGIFGGHVFDTPGSYARGGLVGGRRGFAGGGYVNILPHLALGGDIADIIGGPAPSLSLKDSGSPWADVPHMGSMDLRTNHGDARVMGPQQTLKNMAAAARDSADAQTGQRPSWYRGR